jgi:hypothetical protein
MSNDTKIFFTNLDEFATAVGIWYRQGLHLFIEQGCGGGWWVTITGSKM